MSIEKDPPSQPAAPAASLSRRDFLALAWKSLLGLSGTLGLAGLWRYFSYETDPAPQTVFDLGPAENYPPGAQFTVAKADAWVAHTAAGFTALSLVCPHLGCTLEAAAAGFSCPCHGSRFALDGKLERGPADKPMRPVKASVDAAGHLILDTSES